ncbi:MAG: hypothetical protein AAGM21_15385 [Pseudomonadota bacterium]
MTMHSSASDKPSIEEIIAQARPDQIARLLNDLRHPEREPSDIERRLQ